MHLRGSANSVSGERYVSAQGNSQHAYEQNGQVCVEEIGLPHLGHGWTLYGIVENVKVDRWIDVANLSD
jgi:hypothetical protein